MRFGEYARAAGQCIKAIGISLVLLGATQSAHAQAVAQAPAAAPAPVVAAPAAPVVTATAAAGADDAAANDNAKAAAPAGAYVPMKPTAGKGMPVDGRINVQDQYSPTGQRAQGLHTGLLYIITAIVVLVFGLLVVVAVRFNKRANPVPSKVSHNTLIEIIWTAVPILILVGVAVPSLGLLAEQFKPAPAKALTVKVTGYQWYWTYTYPDNGGFEVISNMLSPEDAAKRGEPSQLAADFRMVVPVGEPIRLQITAADVIHAFAVPSLWFKLDAVPGRINEKVLIINEPGVYYGQCSELCGARHGYMPITVEALPRDKYNAWVMTQAGGAIDGQPKPAEAPAEVPAAAAAPAAAPAAPASPAPAA